jgi:hypothetical protein
VIGDIRTKGGLVDLGPAYCIRGLSFLGGSQFNREREDMRRISGRIIGVQEGMRTAEPARTPPKKIVGPACVERIPFGEVTVFDQANIGK